MIRQAEALADTFAYYATLLILQVIDFFVLIVNLLVKPFEAGCVVPGPFSPRSPPPFLDRPGPWFVCVAAGWLGRGCSPNWLWNWAHYSGVGAGGDWGEPVKPDLGEDKDSRSPCPAIK